MIKFKEKSDSSLSRKGIAVKIKTRGLIKKIIILFITIIISLSTLLMPCLISSFSQKNSCIVNTCALEDNKQTNAQSYIDNIINDYLKELKDKGYNNVNFENISNLIEFKNNNYKNILTHFSEEEIKNKVLNNFIFYAEYVTLSNNETIYYFKTVDESKSFIEEINKYETIEYNKTEKVKKIIGIETSQDILQEEIQKKKEEAERRAAEEAKRKAEEEKQRLIEEQKRQQQLKEIRTNEIRQQQVILSSNNEIVNFALQFNGNPYVYGGTSLTNGADCSGFVQSVYKNFGIYLPRIASDQASAGYAVSFDNLQPGDLVFYSGDGGYSITHVALYIGNGNIIHAMNPADGIGITSVHIMIKMAARRVL